MCGTRRQDGSSWVAPAAAPSTARPVRRPVQLLSAGLLVVALLAGCGDPDDGGGGGGGGYIVGKDVVASP